MIFEFSDKNETILQRLLYNKKINNEILKFFLEKKLNPNLFDTNDYINAYEKFSNILCVMSNYKNSNDPNLFESSNYFLLS